IDDPQRKQQVVEYLEKTLQAEEITDTVFVFHFVHSQRTFPEVLQALQKRIDLEHDILYLWDMDESVKSKRMALFETRIG
ncbi:MAG: hypothetical protein AAGJ35_13600, partial [Myxococcota bacterium]